MPDLFSIFTRWWKFILGFALLAAIVALVIGLLAEKQFLGEATALPVNSVTADKGRIFSDNIQELYSSFGTADELDRIEGTAVLDTLFIATVNEFGLVNHYGLPSSGESFYRAAMKLKRNSKISRSAYGELKVKVWDRDRNLVAAMANFMLQRIQELHQQLQNENNRAILEQIRQDYAQKQQHYRTVADSARNASGIDAEIHQARKTALYEQLISYEKMMNQYQLALSTNPRVLLTVEPARPPVWHDRPKILQIVLLAFFAGLIFAFLMTLFFHNRKI